MSNKLVFILIGVVLLVVVGLGGGFFLMWTKMSTMNAQVAAVPNAQAAMGPNGQAVLGPIFSLDTFIVNLADKGGNRYLRVGVPDLLQPYHPGIGEPADSRRHRDPRWR